MDQGLVRPYSSTLGVFCQFLDAFLLIAMLYVSVILQNVAFGPRWVWTSIVAAFLFMLFAKVFPFYRSWRTSARSELFYVTSLILFFTASSLLFLNAILEFNQDFHGSILVCWISLTYLILITWRLLLKFFLSLLRSNDFNSRRAIILGATESGLRLRDELKKNLYLGIKVVGVFDDRKASRLPDSSVKLSGCCNDAMALARQGSIDHIYIALPFYAKKRTNYLLDLFSDTTCTVFILPNFYEYQLLNARWHQIGSISALSIHDTPFHGVSGWVKRFFDIFLSSVFLVLLFLPLLLIAISIKLTSKGPIIFVQQRYGLDGKKIKIYKFRTMTVMDDGDVIKQATRNDTRCTPVGKLLRSTSLDELPQLINVLQGRMSIVGPRPHAVAHNEAYRKLIRGYMLRHKVRPGITGWAQVNGWRGETESVEKMENRVKYDLDYINRWSLYLDIKIIFMTILNGCMFSKENY